jgi:hypothetical protein
VEANSSPRSPSRAQSPEGNDWQQQQMRQLETVSEEDAGTVSSLDSFELANLGLDSTDFAYIKKKHSRSSSVE